VRWIVAAALILAAAILVDRAALWAEARGWLYRRRRPRRAVTGGGVLGELIEVFQPSRGHVVEERDRQLLVTGAVESGAPMDVDLEAGRVRVGRQPGRRLPPR